MSLEQQIAKEISEQVSFISIQMQTPELVFFMVNGAEFSAKLLKNGSVKKGSIRRD